MRSEQDEVNLLIAEVFDRLGIPYFIGGSLASSTHGMLRATNDSDFVTTFPPEIAADFVTLLGDRFYSNFEAIKDAAERCSTFNLIHLDTLLKVDVFVTKSGAFLESQMARRVAVSVGENGPILQFAGPEDTILAKLDWYRQGAETSDRQWNDILGVLKVQGDALDFKYLGQWSAELGVNDLLDRAREDAGV